MTTTPQEIAFELTIQTGQVYTCPDGERVQGPERAYSIRPFWRDHKILQICEIGPAGYTRSGDSIKCNAARTPESIARDIRNRLPNAAEFYKKSAAEIAEKARITALCKEQEDFFRSIKMSIYKYNSRYDMTEKNIRAHFEEYLPEDVTIEIYKLTAAQAAQIIEFTRSIQK